MSYLADTLYTKYIKERENSEIIESAFGFITYEISGKECFLRNMYTDPRVREFGKCKELFAKLTELAIEAGCEFISGNIYLKDPHASKTLLISLKTGFEVAQANNGIILIVKQLGAKNG